MTAYWNKAFVAVCDRCGTERGRKFEGGSVIAGPGGDFRAGPVTDRGVRTLLADCDLSRAADKRVGEHNDALADRRPAHYVAALVAPPASSVASALPSGDPSPVQASQPGPAL